MKILAELAIAVAAVILIVVLACLLVEPAHAALHPASLERAPALVSVAWAAAGSAPVSCPVCWSKAAFLLVVYGAASAGACGGFILAAMFAAGGRP
jgi:hypothetical protein